MTHIVYCYGGPRDGEPVVSSLPAIRFPVAAIVEAGPGRTGPMYRAARYDRYTYYYPLECALENGPEPRLVFVSAYIVEGVDPEAWTDDVCHKAIREFLES